MSRGNQKLHIHLNYGKHKCKWSVQRTWNWQVQFNNRFFHRQKGMQIALLISNLKAKIKKGCGVINPVCKSICHCIYGQGAIKRFCDDWANEKEGQYE